MKKITTTLLLAFLALGALAQIPNDYLWRFEFDKKSLINYAPGAAEDLTVNADAEIDNATDRFGKANKALYVGNTILGTTTTVRGTNITNQTLSIWIQKDTLNDGVTEILNMFNTGNRPSGMRIKFSKDNVNGTRIGYDISNAIGNDGDAYIDGSSLIDGKWHLLVWQVNYNSTSGEATFKLEIDNSLDAGLTETLTVGSSWNYINGGRLGITPNQVYQGNLDDIRYYTRALSTSEKTSLFTETPQKIVYVDADATGDETGADWANAYSDLQDAFNHAYLGSEIWVADGTYIRDRKGGTERNYVFVWQYDSLKVYGGFDGSETSIDQRDWDANPTILSGNYDLTPASNDNALAVLIGPILPGTFGYIDGIKITEASANTSGEFGVTGGAIYFGDFGSTHFKNIEIYNNYSSFGNIGGYIYTENLNVTLENVHIHDNRGLASTAFLFRVKTGNPSLNLKWINCLIENNECSGGRNNYGNYGDFLSDGGDFKVDIINCTMANNTSKKVSTSGKGNLRVAGTAVDLNIYNSILFGNSNPQDVFENPTGISSVAIFNSVLSGNNSFPASWTQTDTITIDPLFTDTAARDFTLTASSPAVNAGTLSIPGFSFPTTDFAGNPRNLSKSIDIGCYEFQGNASVKRQAQKAITVYPNPATNTLNIVQGTDRYTAAHILDVTGKVLHSFEGYTTRIDITTLPTGVYILQLEGAESNGFARFIKN